MGLVSDTVGALSIKVHDLVCARKVFVPNGKTRRGFQGRIVGHYRRVGPNPWDDYTFVSEPGETVEVFPGIKVQIERREPKFRMQMRGKVKLIEWVPGEADPAASGEAKAVLEAFLRDYVDEFANKKGVGAAAFIAKTLRS